MHARHVIQKVRRCIYWHTVFSLPPVWLLETRLMMVRPTRTAPEPNTNTTGAMTKIQTQVQRCQAKLICNKIAHVTNIGAVIHWYIKSQGTVLTCKCKPTQTPSLDTNDGQTTAKFTLQCACSIQCAVPFNFVSHYKTCAILSDLSPIITLPCQKSSCWVRKFNIFGCQNWHKDFSKLSHDLSKLMHWFL